ncbi:hypothetical protein DTO164E3_8848 [Paecilomyces variotii]|nr:hypothetical protein DTO164E3_8848 [Paecilomyces variotii]
MYSTINQSHYFGYLPTLPRKNPIFSRTFASRWQRLFNPCSSVRASKKNQRMTDQCGMKTCYLEVRFGRWIFKYSGVRFFSVRTKF